MVTAFISDLHANLDALEVVVEDIAAHGADRVFCLGDVVGYGPQPNECVDIVRELCESTVVGNHDYAALGRMDTLAFNEYARAAADWTTGALTPESVAYLGGLPLEIVRDGRMPMRLVHASPLEPERWTYVLSFMEAIRQFGAFPEQVCFIGHSHLPIVIEQKNVGDDEVGAVQFPDDGVVDLDPECRYIVNVGSVGQPRDRDPRAAYALFDDENARLTLRRLVYPVAETQKKIRAAGLPDFLATRLEAGV